jgi:hypothetical protein
VVSLISSCSLIGVLVRKVPGLGSCTYSSRNTLRKQRRRLEFRLVPVRISAFASLFPLARDLEREGRKRRTIGMP